MSKHKKNKRKQEKSKSQKNSNGSQRNSSFRRFQLTALEVVLIALIPLFWTVSNNHHQQLEKALEERSKNCINENKEIERKNARQEEMLIENQKEIQKLREENSEIMNQLDQIKEIESIDSCKGYSEKYKFSIDSPEIIGEADGFHLSGFIYQIPSPASIPFPFPFDEGYFNNDIDYVKGNALSFERFVSPHSKRFSEFENFTFTVDEVVMNEWIGGYSYAWSDAKNWSKGVPKESDFVVIESGDIKLNDSAFLGSIFLGDSASLLIEDSGVLTFFENFYIAGSLKSSKKSKIIAAGSIESQLFSKNDVSLYNFIVQKKNSSFYALSKLNILGTLDLLDGQFYSNGNLVLKSNSEGTGCIGPIATGSNIVGRIEVEKYISGNSRWSLLASPINNSSIADWDTDIITSGFPGSDFPNYGMGSIFTYDPVSENELPSFASESHHTPDSLEVGKGYFVWTGSQPFDDKDSGWTIDAHGDPNVGANLFSVSYDDENSPASESGWNLLGNPYPCTVDWLADPGWVKENISLAIYTLDPDLQVYSVFINGVGTLSGSRFIESGQGFWVRATDSNPILKSSEDSKITPLDLDEVISLDRAVVNISLHSSAGVKVDETAIYLWEGATGFKDDMYDASKLFPFLGKEKDRYGIWSKSIDGEDLAINAIDESIDSAEISIQVGGTDSGRFTFEIAASLRAQYDICFKDSQENRIIKLRDMSSYDFIVEDEASLLVERFSILLKRKQEIVMLDK